MKKETDIRPLGKTNPYSSYSDNSLLDEVDTRFLSVCKRSLIASLSLQSGPVEDAVEKFENYQSTLGNYLLMVTNDLYLPLHRHLEADKKPVELQELERQNRHINKRLSLFLRHPGEKAADHRMLFSYAIMRADKIITQHHINERSVLYPLYSESSVSRHS
ncbi:MAG: hypothetical protein KTR18_06425 [Acidiferrobacterales bacterium]|nr:hypothetical protein [Acidiferrobacterales bacterium]